MGLRDLNRAAEIDDQCFEMPWTSEDFAACLKNPGYVSLVMECQEEMAGYAVYRIGKCCLEIINFAIESGFQRRGFGQDFMRQLKASLVKSHKASMYMDIAETNLPAQLFLRHCGFVAAETIKSRWKEFPEIDAIRFVWRPEWWVADS